jgi:hypothetical protein
MLIKIIAGLAMINEIFIIQPGFEKAVHFENNMYGRKMAEQTSELNMS